MNFDMTKPCGGECNCPFRKDSLMGWLGKTRAEEIVRGLYEEDSTFACHKTTVEDPHDFSERITTKDSQHCAGAMIMMEKSGTANQMMRIAERLRMYDRTKLDMNAPVFDTPQEFIDHHTI